MTAPAVLRSRPHPLEVVGMVLATVLLTVLSAADKLTCSKGVFASNGASTDPYQDVVRKACYSDVLSLWGSRGLIAHLVPYVHGTYTADPPAVHGGTVEYPALTGLFVWLTALPVSTDVGFLLVTTCVFAVVGVLVTLLLVRVAGRRAWAWAATPPLALYALYNWDVLPVLMTALGIALVVAGPRRWSPTTRVLLAAAAFGVGGALKLYPIMFVLPLALAVLTDGRRRTIGRRLLRALAPIGVAVGVVAVVNVPLAVVNFTGWFSVFRFQAARNIDRATLSIWYWGLRPWSDDGTEHIQHLMSAASTAATAVGIVVVVVVSLLLARGGRPYPWLQTSAALLCVYMAFNKVDSLQYTLWLLPFFVTVRIRVGWIAAYLVADLCAFVGWFRWLYYLTLGHPAGTTWADQALALGVWGRAVLLVCMVVAFLASPTARLRGTADPALPERGWTDRVADTGDGGAHAELSGADARTGAAVPTA
ncbi:hypothetical protein [Curtobacterium sp. MCBD17_003]|uniref:hypothetical protein n=1 Tax=Curtobacterium sp. MCBD17_003 TaxID=2175667 RepID=UPI000DA79021|nr:hypothetical protein [Curtobacterium sp. MCBD17_003]WIE53553.1 hypothetical protein DEI88_010355 [Curtobacterium sp. MCBD17_003]